MPELGAGLKSTLTAVVEAAIMAEKAGFPLFELEYEGKFDHSMTINEHIEGKIEIAAIPALPVPIGISLGGTRDRMTADSANLIVRAKYVRTSVPTPSADAPKETPFLGSGAH